MNHFRVAAGFYLSRGVDPHAFTQMLVDEFTQVTVEQIHGFKIDFDSPDTIEVEFFVATNTYREATEIAKRFLSSVETEVNSWLNRHAMNSIVTDESLLLMPA